MLRSAGQVELDMEWVELMVQAKEIGLNVDEIREFLQSSLNNQK